MSATVSDNGVKMIPTNKLEISKPHRIPCEAFQIDPKDHNEKPKPIITDESSKHQRRNDLDQYKLQERICKLDKLGKSIPSLPGKRVLDKNTYGRLQNAAVVRTIEERQMAIQQHIANEERLKNESQARKEQLQKYSMFKTKGPKLARVSDI